MVTVSILWFQISKCLCCIVCKRAFYTASIPIIRVTSHELHGVSNHRRLDSLFISLFRQTKTLCSTLPALHVCHAPANNVTSFHVNGLVQERRNSIADALELRLSCNNPSMSWGLHNVCAPWKHSVTDQNWTSSAPMLPAPTRWRPCSGSLWYA